MPTRISIPIPQLSNFQFPLEEIQKATNNFSKEHIIEKGDSGCVYKGELLHAGEKINVTIRRFEHKMEFLTEVSVLSRLNHPNIVSLIGFCDEKGQMIIITRHEAKLSEYTALTWIQRLNIIVGVARAISHIHSVEGRGYSIIHQNITSDTILLDDKFEAKLSGFEFSIEEPVNRTERYIPTVARQNPGYTDPETLKPGVDVTQKSDIYSFGIVLFEIMCRRKAFSPNESGDNKFIAPDVWLNMSVAINALHEILIPDMWKQMDPESCKEFVGLTLRCLERDPVKRLSMHNIRCFLENYLEIQLGTTTPGTSSIQGVHIPRMPEKIDQFSKSKINKLVEVNKLKRIELRDIKSATNDFSKESELWSKYHYGLLYKGDLELSGKKYNVRILRIDNATAVDLLCKEIEILSTCKHDNIDSLLGFCDGEGSHMILVYEGNTYNHLSLVEKKVLTWEMRLKICLNVAHGLNYLHNEMKDQKMVIHRQLSSHCIMLDGNWEKAKITGFGLSTFHENQDEVPLFVDYAKKGLLNGAGLRSMAPEISERVDGWTRYKMAKATKNSDIYSFGVIMFEILCGASCTILRANDGEFRPLHWFEDRKIRQQVAEVLRAENRGNKLFLKKGPNEDSLDTFINIAEQCLAVNPEQRPTSQVIIEQLEKALDSQKNHKDPLRMSLEVIKLATNSFTEKIGSGRFGTVYEGKLAPEHGSFRIAAKQSRSGQGDQEFNNELHILSEYMHENVISLLGYNNDEQERIIVYEHASKGSLNTYLDDERLTWINRLNICIDVARGLAFLHAGQEHEAVIHRDIKPANILLFDDWKAKVADFGLSLIYPVNDEKDYAIILRNGTLRYLDPVYRGSQILTEKTDIYSFGVVLLDILCGTSELEVQSVKKFSEEGRIDELVFNAIKNQIVPEALATFQAVAYECLQDDREKRPTTQHVLEQLQKALELQVKGVPSLQES